MDQVNNKFSPIQKLLSFSLILQLIYFAFYLLVNIMQQPFMELFGILDYDQIYVNWPGIAGTVMTTAIFVILYTQFSGRLRANTTCTTGFGVALIICAFTMVFVIPSAASLIHNFIVLSKLNARQITTATFSASTVITRVVSLLNVFYLPSIIMLICAYSMYWFNARNDS
ncbi:MAG: hypothetical protein GX279_01440 [Clostridiaceae bacterium]|jgi:hypothetical protein|nr:hypothetical protein [Clostridiaceae bacterium]